MDYIKSTLIIFTFTTFLYVLFIIMFNNYIKKPKNIYYYYVNNIVYSLFYSFTYIIIFIVFLYGLRISNMNQKLDLTIIWQHILDILSIYYSFHISFQFILLIIVLLIFANILFVFLLMHKFFMSHIFNSYLFFTYNYVDSFNNTWFFNKARHLGDSDLISYYLKEISFHIIYHFLYDSNKLWSNYYSDLPWYNYHKFISQILSNKWYINVIVPSSPLIVVLYDILYYDFILKHVYYYLLFYIPLMLLRKITISISTENETICELIWDILYKEEHCLYLLSENHKTLFDLYIKSGMRIMIIDPTVAEIDLHYSMYMKEVSRFIYSEREKCYQGSDSLEIYDYVKSSPDSIIKVTRWLDGEEFHEYWILIIDKEKESNNVNRNTNAGY
jgi:hypothetical protein